MRVVKEAASLRDAGCFALVLECVPPSVGAAVTDAVDIPVIGIGAGPHTSGQVVLRKAVSVPSICTLTKDQQDCKPLENCYWSIENAGYWTRWVCLFWHQSCHRVMLMIMHLFYQVLVYHDLLGFMQHPHHAKVTPKFCKQFGQVGKNIQDALGEYKKEVESREFPGIQYSPYKIKPTELEEFSHELDKLGLSKLEKAPSLPDSSKPRSEQSSWLEYLRAKIGLKK